MSFFHRQTDRFEHFFLYITFIDPHRSAAYFITVQYEVISLSEDLPRISVEQFDIFFTRSGKRMVFGHITFLFFVPTKQWEINDPGKFKYIIIDQTELTADFKT
ncbi:hypothetical protein D1872_308450 [compost metagenome]